MWDPGGSWILKSCNGVGSCGSWILIFSWGTSLVGPWGKHWLSCGARKLTGSGQVTELWRHKRYSLRPDFHENHPIDTTFHSLRWSNPFLPHSKLWRPKIFGGSSPPFKFLWKSLHRYSFLLWLRWSNPFFAKFKNLASRSFQRFFGGRGTLLNFYENHSIDTVFYSDYDGLIHFSPH